MESKPPNTVSFDQRHLPEHGGDPVIDRDVFAILEELADEDDPDLVAEIIELFLVDSAERMQQVGGEEGSGDPDAVRGAAHALKSSSANIGALGFSKACAGLESAARDGRFDELDSLVASALVMYEDVRKALAFSPVVTD